MDNATSPGHNSLTFKNNVSMTRGKQSIKFGTQLQFYRDHIKTITSDTSSEYSFTSLQNFLQARPVSS